MRATDVRVRVAASTANLGSGFDCVGCAFDLYDELELELAGSGVRVEATGEGAAGVPTDESHLVVASIKQGLNAWGVAMPSIRLRTHNSIPHSRGLGSSAAAIVGGLALAWGIAFPGQDLDRQELFRLATIAEGHPDNAGASVFGGALLAWTEAGQTRMIPVSVHPAVEFKAFVPAQESATVGARKVLPDLVPRADAVVQATRAALLLHALGNEPELLLVATQDLLHQDYREPLMPASLALMHQFRSQGVAAVVSGAGPTVLALGPSKQLESLQALGFAALDLRLGAGVVLEHD